MTAKSEFYNELKIIQDIVTNNMISNSQKYNSMEDVIIDTTYETIYKILELIDGYGSSNNKYEIINLSKKEILNKTGFLHDNCEEYLFHTSI